MSPRDDELLRLARETHDKVTKLETAIFGLPDTEDKGLCGEVRELSKSHYNLRRLFFMLLAFMVGAGFLTGLGLGDIISASIKGG